VYLTDIATNHGGFKIFSSGDHDPLNVARGNDVNGDGIADILIGAHQNDPTTHVVFGRSAAQYNVDLDTLAEEKAGFELDVRGSAFEELGLWAESAGDWNRDGYADFLVGNFVDSEAAINAGAVYLVYGKADTATVYGTRLRAGVGGLKFVGADYFDLAGANFELSGGGDLNDDGIADLLIGANQSFTGRPGHVYVVFGTVQNAPENAFLQSIGDTNHDSTPEIAVIARTADGKNLATVKDAATGSLIAQFEFSAALRPVDVTTLPAPDPSAAPGLILLGAAPASAETRDALTGQLRGSVAFDPTVKPVDLTVLPDQNGNGIPELAMLATGSTTVEIRDARDGTWLNTLSFPAQFTPRQVLALPDLNGNGSAEVGVVLSEEGKADRVTVKDARTGALLKTLWSGADLRQAEPVADRNGNGAPEVAMLWQDPAAQTTHVWVVDAGTQQRLASLAKFRQGADSLKLVVVDDLTGNRVEDYAVLGRNPLTGDVTVTVLDGATGQWLNRISYNPDCTPLDLASIADTNGNGAADLVMLGRCGADRTLRAFVKDAKTGTLLQRLNF
jgi:hypothetical protein